MIILIIQFVWKLTSTISVGWVHEALTVVHCWIPQSAKCVITHWNYDIMPQTLMTMLTPAGPHTLTTFGRITSMGVWGSTDDITWCSDTQMW